MTLAEKMIMYRARNRITQKELAQRAGVSYVTINKIERGEPAAAITQAKIRIVIEEGEANDSKH